MFGFKNKKPPIKFFNSIPGVSTLYPVTKSSELIRDWVTQEKKVYNEDVSKCPIKRFTNITKPVLGMPPELATIISQANDIKRGDEEKLTSIGKCPAINSIMHNGFIIYAPADFTVYAPNKEKLDAYYDSDRFPPFVANAPKFPPYIDFHGAPHASWLKDSTKDSTNDTIIKIHTMWSVLSDPDIMFLQMKVPYVKENRFTAVSGILDPMLSTEINIQLWWHVNEEKETTIKAGTPLAMYLPVSRKLFDNTEMFVGTADDDDREMLAEYSYLLSSNFSENRKITKIARKLYKKYWNKWTNS